MSDTKKNGFAAQVPEMSCKMMEEGLSEGQTKRETAREVKESSTVMGNHRLFSTVWKAE